MIKPTAADIGRRVRLTAIPAKKGTLVDHIGCQVCVEGCCCHVKYDRPRITVPTDTAKLSWDDEAGDRDNLL